MADNKELLIKIKGLDELTPVMLKALSSMEAAATKLTQSVEKVNAPLTTAKGKAEGLNTGVVNLAAGLNVMKMAVDFAVMAWGKLSGELSKAVDEAIEAEQASNKLSGALISQGLNTEKNTAAINKYVDAVEAQTGVSGEAIKQMIAMGVQMGLSIEKSQQMEEAARKLAVATGVDVMTAFNQLQGALNGQTRGLAKVIPGVKDLTEAQLKQGEAINLVNKELTAQYEKYQGSFSAGVEKARNALNNVYEAVGNIIIQNPVVTKALDLFTAGMGKIQKAVEAADKWIKANQAEIERFGAAIIKASALIAGLATAFIAVTSGAAIFATGVTALGTAINFMLGPIGLAVLAVGALIAALYKFPGLFDQIVGSLKIFAGFFLEGIGSIASATAKLVGFFNKDLAESLNKISGDIENQAAQWQLAGVKQTEYGDGLNKTAEIAVTSAETQKGALENIIRTYDDLAKAKNAAEALEGTGSSAGIKAKATLELEVERQKQADLKTLREKGAIDMEAYQVARLASQQRIAAIELTQAQAQQQALADALGTSEAGYQMKQQIDQQRFELELQQKITRAEIEGATEQQIYAMKDQMQLEFLAKKNNDLEAHYQAEAAMLDASGQRWAGNNARIQAEQVKHGKFIGTVRGVQQTEEFKGTQQFLTDLGSLRNSKNKKAFEVGKAAGIAQATINTFTSATAAYASMAAIPFVGPALGAAAAAAAIAAGIANIAQISSQQFQGGQADEGMDNIPGSLSGKSFILSQGERVVQPEANKDLTAFLNKEKASPNGRGGQSINITLNYNGMGGAQDAKAMAEIVVREIRTLSERGVPVISARGVVS